MSSMWVDPADDPRTYGNPKGEKATLREYLCKYRLTLDMKCGGLDAEQLARRSVPPSTLSLIWRATCRSKTPQASATSSSTWSRSTPAHGGHADLLRECIAGRTRQ
jgi:hypothetical protein